MMERENNSIDSGRGIFTISLDFELIWGTQDLFGIERFRRACEIEREVVIDRLLDLFTEYDVQATWCVVGHLLLDRCDGSNGKHPEIVRPSHSWCERDWFEHDPGGDEQSAPLFLGRSLIEKIRSCPVPQEIGSHSFSHVIFGDPGCSIETAESEVRAAAEAARNMGIQPRAFAFPRNSVGHLDVLRRHGFACYRGPEPNWYEGKSWPHALKRLAHLWEVLTAAAPPVVLPEVGVEGLWNIPGSMIYFPMHGSRRWIPVSARVRRAIKGLNAAVERKRIFHLWFHPTNLVDKMEDMFDGLRQILEYSRSLRERGQLDLLPMSSIASAALAGPLRTHS